MRETPSMPCLAASARSRFRKSFLQRLASAAACSRMAALRETSSCEQPVTSPFAACTLPVVCRCRSNDWVMGTPFQNPQGELNPKPSCPNPNPNPLSTSSTNTLFSRFLDSRQISGEGRRSHHPQGTEGDYDTTLHKLVVLRSAALFSELNNKLNKSKDKRRDGKFPQQTANKSSSQFKYRASPGRR